LPNLGNATGTVRGPKPTHSCKNKY
jgi:hypothetical protein